MNIKYFLSFLPDTTIILLRNALDSTEYYFGEVKRIDWNKLSDIEDKPIVGVLWHNTLKGTVRTVNQADSVAILLGDK